MSVIKKIIASANLIRSRLDAQFLNPEGYADPTGYCLDASVALCLNLAKKGIKAQLVKGLVIINKQEATHFWIEVGDLYIDITGDQFGNGIPKVYIFSNTKPNPYYRAGSTQFWDWHVILSLITGKTLPSVAKGKEFAMAGNIFPEGWKENS